MRDEGWIGRNACANSSPHPSALILHPSKTMNIKSYRSASLREAPTQIKEELAEDALVLETKQVRAGGFLGVGARNLIEVRVAPNPQQKPAPPLPTPNATAPPRGGKINLTDDSTATPAAATAE